MNSDARRERAKRMELELLLLDAIEELELHVYFVPGYVLLPMGRRDDFLRRARAVLEVHARDALNAALNFCGGSYAP